MKRATPSPDQDNNPRVIAFLAKQSQKGQAFQSLLFRASPHLPHWGKACGAAVACHDTDCDGFWGIEAVIL
jgi:hypothetical protein